MHPLPDGKPAELKHATTLSNAAKFLGCPATIIVLDSEKSRAAIHTLGLNILDKQNIIATLCQRWQIDPEALETILIAQGKAASNE